MELRQLRWLVVVVDAGTMRRASEELHVSQPSISRAVRQLEADLGVQLLRRTPSGVHLTEAGAEFLVYARTILAHATAARIAMTRRPG